MKRLRLIFFIVTFSLALVLYLAKTRQIKFDQRVWLSSKQCKPIKEADQRQHMLDDLTENLLRNKRRDAILKLLGEPEPKQVLPDVQRDFVYCLGRGYGLTMNWLLIHLDSQGNFGKYEVIQAD